jgi:FkbM family methyltransferase
MISYGQNGEDVLLNRLFPADHKGFYIDVGASHPTVGSVTAHFYARGWQGINVEPSCSYGQMVQARPRDTNLQLALSNQPGMATFHEFPEAAGLSTFTPDLADFAVTKFGFRCVRRTVVVSTLAEICREHVRKPIDFLSVDVEGHERAVLEGADWKRFRPRAVVVEATRPHTTETTHAEWEDLLLSADYLFAFFDGLNRFYVRAEDRDLAAKLAVPANVFDNFVTYSEQCSLDRLHALTYRLDTTEQLGRVPLAVASRLNDIENGVRRLPAAIRRLLGGA